MSSDQGGSVHRCNIRPWASRSKSSYPPSRASREDIETCGHSLSIMSSPYHSNITASLQEPQRAPDRDHCNPIYQLSANQSPWSGKQSEGNEASTNLARGTAPADAARRRNLSGSEKGRAVVFWDQEAGRFVPSSATSLAGGTPGQIPGGELPCTGQSIFFGGPLVNEGSSRGSSGGSSGAVADRGSLPNHYQQSRGQRGGQLLVFLPNDYQWPSQLP